MLIVALFELKRGAALFFGTVPRLRTDLPDTVLGRAR